MSVTAKQLSRSGARGKELDGLVREQIQIIDDKLLRADRTWGRNVVSHDLPTVLALPGLDKKDAQRIVYSAILRSLDKRGFETALVLELESSTLYIAWMTDLDVEEVESMNALIRSKRLKRDAVKGFYKHGSMPAPRAASAARQGRAEAAPPMTVTGGNRTMRPRGGAAAPSLLLLPADGFTGGEPAPTSQAEIALLNAVTGP